MTYLTDSQILSRSQNTAIELPPEHAADVVKGIESASVVMQLGRKVRMSSKSYVQPSVGGLPTAAWVNGDTGLKSTTTVQFSGVTLTAEPLATLVVVPDEFFDDSSIPIWSEVKPLIAEAFGRSIDNAALWGTSKPASWPMGLYGQAVAAGNWTEVNSSTDIGTAAALAAQQVAQDGFAITAFAGAPGVEWTFLGARTSTGEALFTTLNDSGLQGIYGRPLAESTNGAWNSNVHLIAGDWDKAIVGVRQDITYTIHTDGVVTDSSGVVIFNAMQQDSKIIRAVMRVGFAIANPETSLNTNDASRFPFSVVTVDNTAGS